MVKLLLRSFYVLLRRTLRGECQKMLGYFVFCELFRNFARLISK